MESSNGEFFTKFNSDDDDQFPTLKHLTAKMAFYINNNTIMNLEKTYDGCFFCECYKYSGCEEENGELGCCTICQLENKYFSHFSFSNKNIDYQIKLLIQLIEDFKKYPDLEMYTGDYTSKSMNFRDGTTSEWSLYKYVFESNYLKKCLK